MNLTITARNIKYLPQIIAAAQRKLKPGERIVLHGADLRRFDLRYVDLRYVDLRGVDLTRVDLRGVDLIGANLIGANLIGANLIGADLTGAIIDETTLIDTPNIDTTNLYKVFGLHYKPREDWEIEAGSRITDPEYNGDQRDDCATGINIATEQWIREHVRRPGAKPVWRVRIPEGARVCIPYTSDGKLRVDALDIVEEVVDFWSKGSKKNDI